MSNFHLRAANYTRAPGWRARAWQFARLGGVVVTRSERPAAVPFLDCMDGMDVAKGDGEKGSP